MGNLEIFNEYNNFVGNIFADYDFCDIVKKLNLDDKIEKIILEYRSEKSESVYDICYFDEKVEMDREKPE